MLPAAWSRCGEGSVELLLVVSGMQTLAAVGSTVSRSRRMSVCLGQQLTFAANMALANMVFTGREAELLTAYTT